MHCPHGTEFVIEVVFAGQHGEQLIAGETVSRERLLRRLLTCSPMISVKLGAS